MAKHKMPEELLAQMKKNWPAAVTPASEVTTHIYRLNDLFVTDARRHTARHGVSYTELQVLVWLRSAPGHELAPTELYSAILISSGGLTKILHGLERRGLIARVADGADRRSRRVRLTPAGPGAVRAVPVLALKASWAELFARGSLRKIWAA